MKKVLSLLLVLTLVLGMSVTSFATGDVPALGGGFSAIHASSGAAISVMSGNEYDFGDEVRPGGGVTYRLDDSAFSGYATNATSDVDDFQLLSLATGGITKVMMPKVISRVRISKGSNVVKKAELNWGGNNKTAQIEVEFIDPFPSNSLDGTGFDFWVYPVIDGKPQDYETAGVRFFGTLKNHVTEIDTGYDYIDLYTGYIADIKEGIRTVEYDLGPAGSDHDVIVVGRAIKGQRYWGIADNSPTDNDADKMDEYDIDMVYHIDQRGGLDKIADHVELRNTTSNDYIFDGELKFLGMGNSKTIPYRATYYIADHMIEVAADAEPEEGEDEEVDPLVVPPEPGGEVSAPAGIFDNPSTGA